MIVALAGQKRSGKNTAARCLVDRGFTEMAFGDGLRQSLRTLDPLVGDRRLSELFDRGLTWESIKATPYGPEVRRLLQVMGTEVGRSIDDDMWVTLLFKQWGGGDIVITDCRFANESRAVHNRGGIVIHIVRPETDDPNPSHPSEVIDFPTDFTIINDGTIDNLHKQVLHAIG